LFQIRIGIVKPNPDPRGENYELSCLKLYLEDWRLLPDPECTNQGFVDQERFTLNFKVDIFCHKTLGLHRDSDSAKRLDLESVTLDKSLSVPRIEKFIFILYLVHGKELLILRNERVLRFNEQLDLWDSVTKC
jgi:hypothetical protein